MINSDEEMKLFFGQPLYVDNVPIHSITLNEISGIGYTLYNSLVNFICISPNKLRTIIMIDDDDITIYNLLLYVLGLAKYEKKHNEKILFFDYNLYISDCIKIYFSMLCNCHIDIDLDNYEIIGFNNENEKIFTINNDNFFKIQDKIKLKNGIFSEDNIVSENPANERTKKLLEKRQKLREKLKKYKQSDDNELTLIDLTSAFSIITHTTIEQIGKYDLYQFNYLFKRLDIVKEYDINIQALLHGADSEKINIKHWASKINIFKQ